MGSELGSPVELGQIVEEHAFALELAREEVPVVPPLVLHADARVQGLELQGNPPTLALLQTPTGTHRFTAATRCATPLKIAMAEATCSAMRTRSTMPSPFVLARKCMI